MDLPWVVTLFPSEETEARRQAEPGIEISPQHGTPFGMRREAFSWGEMMAVDLVRGELLWRRPFGTTRDMTPIPLAFDLGLPNLGGPLITAAGLVFIGASFDNYLRAYDLETGEELWKGRLAAGGLERAGTKGGDHIVAFALP